MRREYILLALVIGFLGLGGLSAVITGKIVDQSCCLGPECPDQLRCPGLFQYPDREQPLSGTTTAIFPVIGLFIIITMLYMVLHHDR